MNQDGMKRLIAAILCLDEPFEIAPGMEQPLDTALNSLKQGAYSRARDQRAILELRFGLLDGKPLLLREVGQIMGVTKERIRQIEAKALRRLRHPSRSKVLKEFIRTRGKE